MGHNSAQMGEGRGMGLTSCSDREGEVWAIALLRLGRGGYGPDLLLGLWRGRGVGSQLAIFGLERNFGTSTR